MGLTYKKSDLDAQIRALTKANAEFKGMITEEMENIAPAIQTSMEFYSDLQKNRISEKMIEGMGVEVSKTGTQLRFGFIKNFIDYFRYQTITGFRHWGSGEFIAPSLALSDAKYDAEALMHEGARRVRRNYMQRLRRR